MSSLLTNAKKTKKKGMEDVGSTPRPVMLLHLFWFLFLDIFQ